MIILLLQFLFYVQHFHPVAANGILMIRTKLNVYFASISTVNDENTQLLPFTKLTDNSPSQIICTEQEIETTIEVVMMV